MSANDDPFYGCCDWIGCRAHDQCADPVLGAQIVEQSQSDAPQPNYSQAAVRARSLNSVQRQAAEFSEMRTSPKAA